MLADLRLRLRSLFQRVQVERELDEELRFHLEHEVEKLVMTGLPRPEAERRARASFGGVERIKDDVRDARGLGLIDVVRQDVRYAWRGLRWKPDFTIAVVTTLALGIGANTVMFGIVDRLLFRAPAYLRSPDRVHRVYLSRTENGERITERTTEYTRFADFRRWTHAFDVVSAIAFRTVAIGSGEDVNETTIAAMSANAFDLFGARPVIGRFFTAAEDSTPGGATVAVLAYDYWQTKFAGRPDVLGRTIDVDRATYTIIGVAPRGFVGLTDAESPVMFVPINSVAALESAAYYRNYNWSWLEIVARRKRGVGVEAATADLTNAYRRSWESERAISRIGAMADADPRAMAGSIHLSLGPEASADSKVVRWVGGVAVVVLLVACANVANLLLARAVRRRREIALRLALGVSRARLLQQLLTESLLLAGLGGVAGLAVARWGGTALRALFLPAHEAVAVFDDARTLAFAAAITLGVAVLTGIAPALHALRGDVAGALKAGAREGHRRSGLRTGLLLFQGTLSVVLLVGAGLFVRSLLNVRSRRLGYDVEPIVYLSANPRGTKLTDAEFKALSERMLEATRATPGVVSATLTVSVPFWSNEGRSLRVPGIENVRKLGRFLLQADSPSYFATTGTRIIRGRAFTDADREGTPRVVVVSESMAKTLWPGRDALGQQLQIGSDTAQFTTVIGIAESMQARTIDGEPEHWYYLPIAQFGTPYPTLFARVNGRADAYAEVLRRRVQEIMPGTAFVKANPLRDFVAPQQRSWEFGATMFAAFGVLALVLAAIGLYSAIAYSVAQRMHELGVRVALGARPSNVLRMVMAEGIGIALAGIAAGSVIALWAGRWVAPLLYAVSPRDPSVFVSVGAALLLAAVAATVVPARRATRVNPTDALRSD